jgi:hypothetical protein
MPTSCNTHDYDGQLREKWFQMRSMLIDRYLPQCLSFDETIKEIEQWLDKKYFNVKRIGRARRSIKILTSQRRGNFDSRNDIDVEELLPILWDKVKNQDDLHDTFYEQLCDITGGSCSQGRSTRLFQFLFLFDLPLEPTTTEQVDKKEKEPVEKDLPKTITNDSASTPEEQESVGKDLPKITVNESSSTSEVEKQQSQETAQSVEGEQHKTISIQIEEKPVEKQQSETEQVPDVDQKKTTSNEN